MVRHKVKDDTLNSVLSTREYRLDNIDMLRGFVIVIMALDHVRDYFMVGGEQDPMTNPEVGAALFFTRWLFLISVALLGGTFMGIASLGFVNAARLSNAEPRRLFALMTVAFGLGQMIGPAFAGVVYDWSGSLLIPSIPLGLSLRRLHYRRQPGYGG